MDEYGAETVSDGAFFGPFPDRDAWCQQATGNDHRPTGPLERTVVLDFGHRSTVGLLRVVVPFSNGPCDCAPEFEKSWRSL